MLPFVQRSWVGLAWHDKIGHNAPRMQPQMQTRIIVRTEITPKAKKQIDDLTAHFGMTQVSLVSRLIERFAEMPRSTQAAMLGLLPHDFQPEFTRLVLERLRELKPK